MSQRKHSPNEREVTPRVGKKGVPAAGAPRIKGYEYKDVPVEVVLPGGDDDVVERRQTLPAPRNLEIVNQIITFAPDGTQYVTVTIRFDEVEGADEYEYRLAKT